jgi:hypothetical protein
MSAAHASYALSHGDTVNAGTWALVFVTGALAIFTAAMAWFTRKAVESSQRTAKAAEDDIAQNAELVRIGQEQARGSQRQADLMLSTLNLGIRPLLADPRPAGFSDIQEEQLLFGAPGRISPTVPWGKLWWDRQPDGSVSHFSVAFENIGSGPAAIVAWRTTPGFNGDVYVSRKFVPVGSLLRVNVSVLTAMPGAERFKDHWWAMEGIEVIIDYTDTNGGEILTSTASIRQYATQGPTVQQIEITRKSDGQVLATGKSSY